MRPAAAGAPTLKPEDAEEVMVLADPLHLVDATLDTLAELAILRWSAFTVVLGTGISYGSVQPR